MDLEKLLAAAQKALAEGTPPAEVNRIISQYTAGRIPDLSGLQGAIAAGETLPEAPKPSNFIVRPQDLLRGAAQGATLGFSDELAGLVAGMIPGGKTAAESRHNVREGLRLFRQEAPGAALGSELIGGLATAAIPGVGLSGAAARAPGLLGASARGLALGAGAGAIAGTGYAEGGLGERARGAGQGAAIGGLLGGLTPGVTRLVTLLGTKGNQLIEAALRPEAAGARAARAQILKAAEASGMSQTEVASALMELEAARPGMAVPADVSRPFAREARRSVQLAPQIEDDALKFLETRGAGTGERLAGGAARATGFPEGPNILQMQRVSRTAQRKVAEELYGPLEAQYGSGSISPEVMALIETEDELGRLWDRVRPKGKELGEAGFKELQTLRQRLEDEVSVAFRAGRGNEGTALRELKDRLTELMETDMPGFRAANRGYAQTVQEMRAYDQGARAFQKPAAAVKEQVANLADNPTAATAYRAAMVDALNRRLRSLQMGPNAVDKLAKAGPELEARLRLAFPDEASFEQFLRQHVATERAFARTERMVQGGAGGPQRSDMGIGAEMIEQGLRFSPGAAAARGVRGIREAVVGNVAGRGAEQAGRQLLTPGRENLTAFLSELGAARRRAALGLRARTAAETGFPLFAGLLEPTATGAGGRF